jgi:hypothetical protein
LAFHARKPTAVGHINNDLELNHAKFTRQAPPVPAIGEAKAA